MAVRNRERRIKTIWQQIEHQAKQMSPEKQALLRKKLLEQIQRRRKTEIISLPSLPVLRPNVPILQTPEFVTFTQHLQHWRKREVAGTMDIDFVEVAENSPAIQMVDATVLAAGTADSVVWEGDKGAFAPPGQIEWHSHSEFIPEYGVQMDWQDLSNMISGPGFADPNETIPTNWRWLTAVVAQYPDAHATTAMQLYLYELEQYDQVDPLSGLFALGPIVKLANNR